MSSGSEARGIPFAFLCSFFRQVAKITPRASQKKRATHASYQALDILTDWIAELHRRHAPLPSGTAAICFRLLFPEEDIKRKYDMQEPKLALYLAKCLGISSESLTAWNSYDSSGCLGHELQRLLQQSSTDGHETLSPLTIAEVDALLDELASTSGFTHVSIRAKYPRSNTRRSRCVILKDLFRPLSPLEAAFLTHIILKDLRPVLYPFPEVHYSSALLDYNSNAVRMLSKGHAMNAWDPSGYMLRFYRIKANLDDAATASELPRHRRADIKPSAGVMIQLPKSVKGTSCHHALSHFETSTRVWAEIKYDGERAQIHVEIVHDGSSKITIYSKSGRDSTLDRHGIHDIIRECLGLRAGSTSPHSSAARVERNIILDAEMVAWHDDHIDEFWRIQGLVERTAVGIRGRPRPRRTRNTVSQADCDPPPSTTDESQTRHLALIFFDILLLDDEPLLFQTYATRRQRLEDCIEPIATRAMLAERYEIDMSEVNPHETLQVILAEQLADHMEGIILKADESEYNEFGQPWVKLKKDYIQGFGDCIDLVIVAASWDRDRGRELRVAPNVYTTFYVGALTNKHEIQIKPNTKPNILVYFTVSYGLSRQELEDLNFRIRSDDPIAYSTSQSFDRLPFTYSLSADLTSQPTIILQTPFLVEMLGAGFTKKPRGRHYELRFPRITKIHNKRERPWTSCMDIAELDKIALENVGKDRKDKDIDDWCKNLWGKPTSPTISMKRKDRVQDIRRTLVSIQGKTAEAKTLGSMTSKRRKLNTSTIKGKSLALGGFDSISRGAPTQPITRIMMRGMENYASGVLEAACGNHAGMLGDAVCCFANAHTTRYCGDCLRWKTQIPKERRVHSLEALLAVCSRTEGGLMGIGKGVIFVGDRAADDVLDQVRDRTGDWRIRVLVFRCDVDVLCEERALLVT